MKIVTEKREFIVYRHKEGLAEARRKVVCDLVGYIGENTKTCVYESGLCITGESPDSRYIRVVVGTGNMHAAQIVDSNREELSRLEAGLMKIYEEQGFIRMSENQPISLSVELRVPREPS